MKKAIIVLSISSFLIFTGCTKQPVYVGEGVQKAAPVTLGLDRGDFEKAAVEATQSMLASSVLDKKDGGKYIVAIDQIINDTTQRIDTDMLIKKIRIAILNSGKAVVTSAIQVGGSESTLSHSVRELRQSDEVKQSTIAKKGGLIAPDFGLSGKIIQRNAQTVKKQQLVEYYFQLTLTQLETGLALWEEEVIIGKLGSNKSVSW